MRCVPAHDFTVAKALAWRSAIADDPPYQRKSAIWSLDKQQLFIDSLLNGYDVPKIYLHDLRGKHPTRVYAVVDGKQRLTTIWGFLTDAFPLADDFQVEHANLPELPHGVAHPMAGHRFSQLDREWQRVLRRTHLAVVLIQNATETDIEDLFSRLNNGEPLTPAERRNAVGGDAAKLVRAVAAHRFFEDRVSIPNARYQHLDAAARLVVLEDALVGGRRDLPDLGTRALDAFVAENRRMRPSHRHRLREKVLATLDRLAVVFDSRDRLLTTQAAIPVLYLVGRSVTEVAPDTWAAALRAGIAGFEDARRDAQRGQGSDDSRQLREFNRLLAAGASDGDAVARRFRILVAALRAADRELARALPSPTREDAIDEAIHGARVHSTAS